MCIQYGVAGSWGQFLTRDCRNKRKRAWWGGEGSTAGLQLEAKTWVLYSHADHRNSVQEINRKRDETWRAVIFSH